MKENISLTISSINNITFYIFAYFFYNQKISTSINYVQMLYRYLVTSILYIHYYIAYVYKRISINSDHIHEMYKYSFFCILLYKQNIVISIKTVDHISLLLINIILFIYYYILCIYIIT